MAEDIFGVAVEFRVGVNEELPSRAYQAFHNFFTMESDCPPIRFSDLYNTQKVFKCDKSVEFLFSKH